MNMRVSTKTRYGLRMLTYLGANQDRENISLKEVSEHEGISIKYLEQIIMPLKTLNILSVTRGKHGGYKLKKNPKEITLLEIFEALEGVICTVDCDENCNKNGCCSAKSIWNSIDNLISDFLRKKSLEDVIKDYNVKNNRGMYYI